MTTGFRQKDFPAPKQGGIILYDIVGCGRIGCFKVSEMKSLICRYPEEYAVKLIFIAKQVCETRWAKYYYYVLTILRKGGEARMMEITILFFMDFHLRSLFLFFLPPRSASDNSALRIRCPLVASRP